MPQSQDKTSLWSCRHVTCYTFSRFSKIVLVAIQDSADTYGSVAISALKRLGAREPIILEFRSSFALAGFAGSGLPSWVSQVQNKRYKGPSILRVTIEGGNKISASEVTCREAISSLSLLFASIMRMRTASLINSLYLLNSRSWNNFRDMLPSAIPNLKCYFDQKIHFSFSFRF